MRSAWTAAGCLLAGAASALSAPPSADRPDLTAAGAPGPGRTEGLVIDAKGVVYYSQREGVGRIPVNGAADNAWVRLPGELNVFGLALDPVRGALFAGAPDKAGRIYRIPLDGNPAPEVWIEGAGKANGLTLGPDGGIWYSDQSGGDVYRVDPTRAGTRTKANREPLVEPNGIAFGPDGGLCVLSWTRGSITRLVLRDEAEAERSVVIGDVREAIPDAKREGDAKADGIAFDAAGRIYVTVQGALRRLSADLRSSETLLTGAGANIEFGAGALKATDIYVAGGKQLLRFPDNSVPGALVPWHVVPK